MRLIREKKPTALSALAASIRVMAAVPLLGWFGHIRFATGVVHTDDHRDLARQAVAHLIHEGDLARDSELASRRRVIEQSCGLLDQMESETGGKVPGKLEWDYSHFYDPLARRGIDDRRYVNAFEEYRDFWERALVHFRIGGTEKACRFLGYCCHLLQDMAVPSHTHCIPHGLRSRTADNLELVSRSRRFRLRLPAGPPYQGEGDMHLKLFEAMGMESRGREPFAPGEENEIAAVLKEYYVGPRWIRGSWQGRYIGEGYYPYHRLLPSSPRIKLSDLVTLRNYLMARAAERTVQLVRHFAEITGAGG